jgi:hypothetical protein
MREKDLKSIKEGRGDLAAQAEMDHEIQMARSELYKIAKYAIKLHEMLKGRSEEQGLEAWQQSKITKAADYMGSVYHNLEYEMKFGAQMAESEKQKGVDGKACWDGYKRMGTKQKGGKTVDNCVKEDSYKDILAQRLDEKSKSKAQQKFMGMVYAAKKGEKPASKDVAKVAKGMSKSDAKDFASTKHKGKPEHVKEASEFVFSPEQEKWLGKNANRQDPYILARMPGAKPPIEYFVDPEDQAIAKKLNFGRQNLNRLKNVIGAKQDDPEVFKTPVATAQPVADPATAPAAAPAPATAPADAPATAPADAPTAPSNQFSKAITALAKANNIKNPNLIKVGQTIKLPSGETYTVAKGDTLGGIAAGKFKGTSTPTKKPTSTSADVNFVTTPKPKTFAQDVAARKASNNVLIPPGRR